MVICAVIGCGNRSKRNKDKSFYQLPSVLTNQGTQTFKNSKIFSRVLLLNSMIKTNKLSSESTSERYERAVKRRRLCMDIIMVDSSTDTMTPGENSKIGNTENGVTDESVVYTNHLM
jgi:hypothetical protein